MWTRLFLDVARIALSTLLLTPLTGGDLGQIRSPYPWAEIPFTLHRDYVIVVQGSIGELHNRNFLVDTGAVPSVVDSRLVRKLKLKGGRGQMSVFTGRVDVEEVVVPGIELGPIRLESLPVAARDLTFVQQGLGIRIDAMIGLDVLGWSNLAIDYEAKKLIFGAQLPVASKMNLEVGPGCMLLPVQIGGRRLRLMVDTGAKDIMLFESRFNTHFPKANPSGRRNFSNFSGRARLKEVELPSLEIGATDLGPTRAVIIPSKREPTPDFDGLIGLKSLKAGWVYFDFEKQLIYWVGSSPSQEADGPSAESAFAAPSPL